LHITWELSLEPSQDQQSNHPHLQKRQPYKGDNYTEEAIQGRKQFGDGIFVGLVEKGGDATSLIKKLPILLYIS
jgi:hypothetical protein